MREMEKHITLNNEPYRVRKMDAFSGSYLLKFLLEKCLPMVQAAQGLFGDQAADKDHADKDHAAGDDGAKALPLISQALSSVSEDDLRTIMSKCLSYADKSLPAGWQPVMSKGSFGVADLEYDLPTCLLLCYHVIAYNCEGFFGDGGSLISQMIGNTKPPIA